MPQRAKQMDKSVRHEAQSVGFPAFGCTWLVGIRCPIDTEKPRTSCIPWTSIYPELLGDRHQKWESARHISYSWESIFVQIANAQGTVSRLSADIKAGIKAYLWGRFRSHWFAQRTRPAFQVDTAFQPTASCIDRRSNKWRVSNAHSS